MPSVEEIKDHVKRYAEIGAEGREWCRFHAFDCVTYDDGTTFRSAFLRVYRKRLLFRTKKGYLGLGPVDTKPGDNVALVAGSRVPYVMKRAKGKKSKNEGRYKLVGEAYVHGIMYGEAFNGGEDGILDSFEMVELV
ncbi:Heterokaryon incompatibility protein 6, OR allele [Diplodia seriata]|uniref:Heterokaryon incompatibility protein 6, OR allele n=1 Tax=Diplodia seriata TaxID=420778 RepID=A0A1S8BKN5_9PEZI|nr:Heterokaryon incompatibility protein 6, OR allele [Diplodia seriata]